MGDRDGDGAGRAGGTPALPPAAHKGWHSRGYLPHFDSPEVIQTLTFRLADSMPRALCEEIARTPDKDRRRRRFDESLDHGLGACVLRVPEAAAIVARALECFDGERYRLLAWVVMPNPVHAMIEPGDGNRLGAIVNSWKTFMAKAINRRTCASGRLWAPDYYDRYVRDEAHFGRVRAYIEENPVRAGLSMRADAWRYSSAWRG